MCRSTQKELSSTNHSVISTWYVAVPALLYNHCSRLKYDKLRWETHWLHVWINMNYTLLNVDWGNIQYSWQGVNQMHTYTEHSQTSHQNTLQSTTHSAPIGWHMLSFWMWRKSDYLGPVLRYRGRRWLPGSPVVGICSSLIGKKKASGRTWRHNNTWSQYSSRTLTEHRGNLIRFLEHFR